MGVDFLCSMMSRVSAGNIPVVKVDFNGWEPKISEGFFTPVLNISLGLLEGCLQPEQLHVAYISLGISASF